ncbi:class I SAM-dependent methyltransferase [Corynebacterium sp. AOP40-9SA-29]|uniref:class I SAM-dependent methyltransferase n=1 Tax=Corynebacterium sp. AOP40-9SA-29 TaxID=3457677 RepID=UPI0040344A5C
MIAETDGSDQYSGDMTAVMAALARRLGIEDDYSKELVEAVEAPSVESFPPSLVERVVAGVRLRTRFLDWIIDEFVVPGGRQVVILGSGLDARAWRLRWPEGTHLWYVDLPNTVKFPVDILGPPDRVSLHVVEADLFNEDWSGQLLAHGFNPELPCLVIAEAVLLYLPGEVASRVADQVAKLSSPGSVLGFTYLGSGNVNTGVSQLAGVTSSLGGDFRSSIDSPAAYLEGTEWSVDIARTYGEYASEVGEEWASDEAGGVSWLCRAVRS